MYVRLGDEAQQGFLVRGAVVRRRAAPMPANINSLLQPLAHEIVTAFRVITLPAPSTLSWMRVIRPVPVSVNVESHTE